MGVAFITLDLADRLFTARWEIPELYGLIVWHFYNDLGGFYPRIQRFATIKEASWRTTAVWEIAREV